MTDLIHHTLCRNSLPDRVALTIAQLDCLFDSIGRVLRLLARHEAAEQHISYQAEEENDRDLLKTGVGVGPSGTGSISFGLFLLGFFGSFGNGFFIRALCVIRTSLSHTF